ncbi:mechanosensitive ion channel protein MscS, partial [Burkholderia sp. SIMBA_019]
MSTAAINPAAAVALPAGLENLINNVTGGSAPPASAAQAASAPSPASQAELARSLDSLIGTLESVPQRKALVAHLKALREGTQSAAPAAPAS